MESKDKIKEWFSGKLLYIIGGEASNIDRIFEYGNSLIISFRNGSQYQAEIGKYTPKKVVLDESNSDLISRSRVIAELEGMKKDEKIFIGLMEYLDIENKKHNDIIDSAIEGIKKLK